MPQAGAAALHNVPCTGEPVPQTETRRQPRYVLRTSAMDIDGEMIYPTPSPRKKAHARLLKGPRFAGEPLDADTASGSIFKLTHWPCCLTSAELEVDMRSVIQVNAEHIGKSTGELFAIDAEQPELVFTEDKAVGARLGINRQVDRCYSGCPEFCWSAGCLRLRPCPAIRRSRHTRGTSHR